MKADKIAREALAVLDKMTPEQNEAMKKWLKPHFDEISKKMPPMRLLERDIERIVCDYATSQGMLVYKFTSPARAAVPDRLFITPRGIVFFIEFKREGAKATPQQVREHQRLRGHHVEVYIIDNVIEGKIIMDQMGRRL